MLSVALDRLGVRASAGSACSAGGTQPSHVLLAMGRTPAQAFSSIRISIGRETREREIDFVATALRDIKGKSAVDLARDIVARFSARDACA